MYFSQYDPGFVRAGRTIGNITAKQVFSVWRLGMRIGTFIEHTDFIPISHSRVLTFRIVATASDRLHSNRPRGDLFVTHSNV
jgi:hypothetical protein